MRRFVLWLIAVTAVVTLARCAAAPPYESGGAVDSTLADAPPLPLDPLRPAEREEAQRIARSDPRVREVVGDGPSLIYVQSIAPKLTPNDDEPRGRHADVLFIDRSKEAGARVLVDLVAGRVLDVDRLPQTRVPLGISDVEEALQIAVASDAVQRLLGARASGFRVLTGPVGEHNANSDFVQGLHHIGATPEDPCYAHRCVYLSFNSGGRMILEEQLVMVDLNTRQVSVSSVRRGGDR